MDPIGHIYESDDVPVEDKARLEGYLRARAEVDDVKRLEAKVRALEALRERDA